MNIRVICTATLFGICVSLSLLIDTISEMITMPVIDVAYVVDIVVGMFVMSMFDLLILDK